MKELDVFCIKGSPSTVTAQQKGLRIFRGHPQFYDKPKVKKAKAALGDALLPFVPDEPYKGKIYRRVLWAFNKKSLLKRERRTFHTKKIDLDNLCKGLLDVMTNVGFWDDDSSIVKLDLTKAWNADCPGLYIQILEVNDQEDYQDIVEEWRCSYG